MLYSMGFNTPLDQAALTFYVLCGLARLARFNVAAQFVPRDSKGKPLYHEGLATPYAGLLLMTVGAVASWLGRTNDLVDLAIIGTDAWYEFHLPLVVVLVMSFLMASKRTHIYLDGGYSIPAATAMVFACCWSIAPLPLTL